MAVTRARERSKRVPERTERRRKRVFEGHGAPVFQLVLLLKRSSPEAPVLPGLANRVLANAPPKNMRPNAAELSVLPETGEPRMTKSFALVALRSTDGLSAERQRAWVTVQRRA